MRLNRRFRAISPVAVATLAVAAAVGGSALAEAGVHSAKKHKKGKAVTLKQVDARIRKLAPTLTVGNATNATHATSSDTAKSSPIASLQYVSNTIALGQPSTGGGEIATANCPAGFNVVGGGAQVSNEVDSYVNDSHPNGRTGWTADGFNNSTTNASNMTVTAICAQAAVVGP